MKTPKQITQSEYEHQQYEYLNTCNYHPYDKTFSCNKCNKTIKEKITYISLHLSEFSSCAGFGEVRLLAVPFCPKCEKEPEESGCFHI